MSHRLPGLQWVFRILKELLHVVFFESCFPQWLAFQTRKNHPNHPYEWLFIQWENKPKIAWKTNPGCCFCTLNSGRSNKESGLPTAVGKPRALQLNELDRSRLLSILRQSQPENHGKLTENWLKFDETQDLNTNRQIGCFSWSAEFGCQNMSKLQNSWPSPLKWSVASP